jgi:hypothetical protein
LHAAIVLPCVIFELDADPFAGCEVREANVTDNADSAIGELDGLADSKVLGRHFWLVEAQGLYITVSASNFCGRWRRQCCRRWKSCPGMHSWSSRQ